MCGKATRARPTRYIFHYLRPPPKRRIHRGLILSRALPRPTCCILAIASYRTHWWDLFRAGRTEGGGSSPGVASAPESGTEGREEMSGAGTHPSAHSEEAVGSSGAAHSGSTGPDWEDVGSAPESGTVRG